MHIWTSSPPVAPSGHLQAWQLGRAVRIAAACCYAFTNIRQLDQGWRRHDLSGAINTAILYFDMKSQGRTWDRVIGWAFPGN